MRAEVRVLARRGVDSCAVRVRRTTNPAAPPGCVEVARTRTSRARTRTSAHQSTHLVWEGWAGRRRQGRISPVTYMVKPRDLAPAVQQPVPPDPSLPRACVIGAGSSGIAAAKALYLAGVPFDCFEKGSVIGGNWVYDNPNGQSACYETLEINTSCPRMAFSGLPDARGLPAVRRAPPGPRLLRGVRRPLRLPAHDHLRHLGRGGDPHRRRQLAGPDRGSRRRGDPGVRRRAGRQRPPLGRALAGAGVPGRLRGRADPRPRLPLVRRAGRPRRGRRRHGQLRPRHLRRGRQGRPDRDHLGAAWSVGDAEVPARQGR